MRRLGVFILTFGITASGALAAQKPITGQLSKPGYRLIALSSTGRASSVRVGTAAFSLRPPSAVVTLQLRAPDGIYAGPVVVGRQGARAIVGVRAGARLGRIVIRDGYATLRRRTSSRWLDATRSARARNGVPIGVGSVGLVRVKLPRHGAPGDRDLDGIPNPIDIDDDGDLILDQYDRPAKSRRARAAIAEGSNLEIVTLLGWGPFGFVNAEGDLNADGTPRDEATVAGDLAGTEAAAGVMGIFWGDAGSGKLELDCGTLIYCSRGGTGLWRKSEIPPPPNWDSRAGRPAFPECCDPDNNGMGSLIRDPTIPGGNGMFLLHGATSDQLHAGDLLIARDTVTGAQYPAAVGFVFASHPVFASYDDGAGDRLTLSYPPPEACRPAGCHLQTPVRAGPNGHVVVHFTVWRPQRPRLDTEPGTGRWMDVGHLAYATGVQVGAGAAAYCPRSSYTETGPNLAPLTAYASGNVPAAVAWADTASDQPTEPRGDPSHAFGFTLDLTDCYAAAGASVPGNPLVQLWTWAIPSDYPSTGASEAHSQLSMRLVP